MTSVPPTAAVPALPLTVAADRAAWIRRRRVAYPVLIVSAVVGGAAVGVLFGALATGRGLLTVVLAVVALTAFVVALTVLPRTRRPPDADWVFGLEDDGLRFPPSPRRAGHPGLLVPWPAVTSLVRRRRAGEDVIIVGISPDAEATLLLQGADDMQARMAVRSGFRLRLTGAELPPARCLQLIQATRAARAGT